MNIQKHKQKGFTLTELMVGVAIGIIGSLVIFKTLQSSQGLLETVTGGGDANQNGSIGTYLIERDMRHAGFGMNNPDIMNCNINAYYEPAGGGAGGPITFTMLPVLITQGASGAPDTLQVTYSSGSSSYVTPAKLTDTFNNNAAQIKINNRYGFQPGNLMLITDPSVTVDVNGVPQKQCVIRQVTDVPGSSSEVIHNSGQYKNTAGTNVPAEYNKPGGTPVPAGTPAFPVSSKIYNLGDAPVNHKYYILNKKLMLDDTFVGASDPLVGNIVQLQALYGFRTATGELEYKATAPVTQAEIDSYSAIKFAVVAMSAKPELAKDSSGVCTTTDTLPVWSADGTPESIDVATTVGANWRCYRYKVFESTATLRNMIWRQ